MKKRKGLKVLLSSLLAFAVIASGFVGISSVAETKTSPTVYVSENDVHYHSENCSCLGTNKIATTVDFAVSAGFTACTKCNPPQATASTTPSVTKSTANTATASTTTGNTSYILNKNTKKFHYPKCSSVSDMKEKNKIYFSGTREEAIAQGYVPCKRCNP